ncbi:hypothetical protein D9M72_650760 [compost metagenome]
MSWLGVLKAVRETPEQSTVVSMVAPISRMKVTLPSKRLPAEAWADDSCRSSGRTSILILAPAWILLQIGTSSESPPGRQTRPLPNAVAGKMLPLPMKSATNSLAGLR